MALKDLINELPPPPSGKDGWPWTESSDPMNFSSFTAMPKISVIIPSYNHGHYIEETIRAVLLQNYPNTELLIMDGGSTDETQAIMEKYRPWVAYMVSEKDNGQGHAINKGLDKITGEISCWINSDDLYKKDCFYHVMKFFNEQPDVTFAIGNCDLVMPGIRTGFYKAPEFEPYDFISRISIHQPCSFWRANVYEKKGKLDESFYLSMDFDFFIRLVFDYKVATIDETLAIFRRYPEAKSSNFENQSGIFKEYRRVVSRFFTTVKPELVSKMKEIGIFENPEMAVYPIERSFSETMIMKMFHIYLNTCMVQEYNMGNKKRCNQMIRHNLTKYNLGAALLFMVKNNLGVRKIFDPYRKF